MPLLDVKNLRTYFPTHDGLVKAVDGVDFSIERGAAVGIVGESGSGKSVLSLSIMGLVPRPPAVIAADAVQFEGIDLLAASPESLRRLRGNRMAMIFQDPMTSLNPYLTIGDQLTEPLLIHKGMDRDSARRRGLDLLKEVGIGDAERCFDAHPHQFSGGMRQRAMVAMALACEPSLLIADEPTTALDVTIQAQILELIQRVRATHGTAVILITHDLGVAAGFCDEIFVMYAGRIVEHAATRDLFARPLHPYTKALMASVPRLDDDSKERFTSIRGAPPDLTHLPVGCAFSPRCDWTVERCFELHPKLESPPGDPKRRRACYVDLEPLAAGANARSPLGNPSADGGEDGDA